MCLSRVLIGFLSITVNDEKRLERLPIFCIVSENIWARSVRQVPLRKKVSRRASCPEKMPKLLICKICRQISKFF